MINRDQINVWLVVSVLALLSIVLVVAGELPAVFGAAFRSGLDEDDPAKVVAGLLAKSEEDFETYQERINGRSFFFKPKPWPRVAAPPRPKPTPTAPRVADTTPAPDPGPPPAPPNYTGPPVLFAVGEQVCFKSTTSDDAPLCIKVGEQKDGIEILATNLPWSVKVAYQRGEYDVPVFDKKSDALFTTPPMSMTTSPIPGLIEVDAKPATIEQPEKPAEAEGDIDDEVRADGDESKKPETADGSGASSDPETEITTETTETAGKPGSDSDDSADADEAEASEPTATDDDPAPQEPEPEPDPDEEPADDQDSEGDPGEPEEPGPEIPPTA